jgi:hypothetical protein
MSDEDDDFLRPAHELGVELKAGWKKADPALEADVKALWERLAILPAGIDPDLRLDEVVSGAYVDGVLAGVSTAFVRELPFLRGRFAMLRVLVAPEYRLHSVSRLLSDDARKVIEPWAMANQGEAVLGMATVHQADKRNNRRSRPVKRGSKMVLVGYTTDDEKILVAWFDHVRV